jgi:hypothetical protein
MVIFNCLLRATKRDLSVEGHTKVVKDGLSVNSIFFNCAPFKSIDVKVAHEHTASIVTVVGINNLFKSLHLKSLNL